MSFLDPERTFDEEDDEETGGYIGTRDTDVPESDEDSDDEG